MGQQEVIKVLEKEEEWMDVKDIINRIGIECSLNSIQQALKRMFPQDVFRKEFREGKIKKYIYKIRN